MVGLELVLILAAAFAMIPALIAHTRGHSAVLYFFFGLVFWPAAMVVVLLVKDQRHRCPHCAEPIRAEALVCPHCRRDLATPGLSATA
jgi:hypothetical protein